MDENRLIEQAAAYIPAEWRQALALARSAGLPHLQAGSLLNLGMIALTWGDNREAKDHLERARHLYQDNLGNTYTNEGGLAKARVCHEQVLGICRLEISGIPCEGPADLRKVSPRRAQEAITPTARHHSGRGDNHTPTGDKYSGCRTDSVRI